MRLLTIICLLIIPAVINAQHPVTFFNSTEASDVKNNLSKYPLLDAGYKQIKGSVDKWLDKDIDVPFPKDAAGGYSHDKHKANYILMFNSGILYNLTGDIKYATLVKNVLLKYAVLNPTLKNHPEATSSSPGHIFWQALNDANWMVYTGMAYDLVYKTLTPSERTKIEDGAFKPEAYFMTHDLQTWFDLLHNHGVWACAGVGIAGIAMGNKDYVDMALYGTAKDGKSGFIAQIDNLFSPDGYYTEGPYYARYAILPYYLFANALNNARPELKIFERRDSILKKALLATLQQTNLNGTFFPLNDALKEKDFTTNELVTVLDIAWNVYGKDAGMLAVAKMQDKVLLNGGGLSIAKALAQSSDAPGYYPYRSVEYRDGVKGDEGGASFLRIGKGASLSTMIFKYTSHGLSHGHFDKLNINLFDKGNEILTDYGSVRFVNVEQKYGGRYLKENDTYASQTIAHNTIVVDETSDFGGQEKVAEKYHSEKLFSSIGNPDVQVVAAMDTNAYKGVKLQRTIYMLHLPDGKKMAIDIFNAGSAGSHQYDLPFHYDGQIIKATFKYKPFTKKQETLGSANGYQFLWKEAEASVADTTIHLTFLNGKTYYSVSSMTGDSAQVFFTRLGANDPDFNLRPEPSFIIRKKGRDQVFVNVIEMHGEFDPVTESSSNSYPAAKEISLLRNDDAFTVALIKMGNKQLLVAQCNKDFAPTAMHSVKNGDVNLSWKGPFAVWYNNKML